MGYKAGDSCPQCGAVAIKNLKTGTMECPHVGFTDGGSDGCGWKEYKALTAEEWKQIERTLTHLNYEVKLIIDDYKVGIFLSRVGTYKNMLVIRINDQDLNLDWLRNDCEERKRFMCPSVRYAYKRKAREELARMKGRAKRDTLRYLKEEGIDLNRTYITYLPFWGSFKKLKVHLLKNNTSIEWANKPQPASEEQHGR